jgi:hypothetical protein
MRRLSLPIALAVVACWTAYSAAAAGGPSPGLKFGSTGVLSRDGSTRWVALWAGPGTVVESVRAGDGSVERSAYVRGIYGLPLVAFDGSTGGLSADGSRLVLSTWPAYGRHARTRFLFLDPYTLRVQTRVELEGAFAFDALSPNGSLMYLTQFLGGPRSGRYAVRAVNVASKRLYPGTIVDPREPAEKMTGTPFTRTGSRDGSWAYTLYSRAKGSPFVHALHTSAREAFCIDLPERLRPDGISQARMRVRGGVLQLRLGGRTIARIDRKTFEVSR